MTIYSLDILLFLCGTYLLFHVVHNEYEVTINCSFNLYFPNKQWCWTSFHVLIGHLYTFFGEMSIQSLGLLLNQLFVFLLLSFRNSLYILSVFTFLFFIILFSLFLIFFPKFLFLQSLVSRAVFQQIAARELLCYVQKPDPEAGHLQKSSLYISEHDLLTWYLISKYCLSFGGLSLYTIDSVFLWWSFKFFNKFSVPIFPFVTCASCSIPKKPLPNPVFWNFCPMLSSESFIGLGFTFRPLIHFELIFVHGAKCPTSYFCMWISNSPSTICWKDCPFPTK